MHNQHFRRYDNDVEGNVLFQMHSSGQRSQNVNEDSNQQRSNYRPPLHMEKHLPYRQWSSVHNQDTLSCPLNPYFKVHIVSYNILSQSALEQHRQLYVKCFRNNLQWHRRMKRLLREFQWQNADILCLQEMEEHCYLNEFQPILMQQGYDSIYTKRTGDKSDGCCIFYKNTRLRLINSRAVSFYQNGVHLLHKDNCGLIALFQPLVSNAATDNFLCVATTHLIFSPKRGDIKLAQLQYFFAEIDQFALKDAHSNSYHPIILCGDFNARPQSPLVQFLLNQYIKYDNYRRIDISDQTNNLDARNCFSYPMPSSELISSSFVTSVCRFPSFDDQYGTETHPNEQSKGVLTHNKQFRSVYDLNSSSDITSNVADEPGLVDYIFYTKQDGDSDRLTLLSYYDLYKMDQIADVHMPSHQFPSDHFLLAAKFALRLQNRQ